MAKKEPEKTTDLAVQPEAQVPATINYDGDAGGGFENVGAKDMAIPFILILQSNSPQVKRGEGHIEGSKEGDLYNTISGELYTADTGLIVIPCGFQKAFVEWKPRDTGGGFVAQHMDEAILAQTKNIEGKDMLPNGNIIVPTAYHYVIIVNPVTKDYSQAVISMSSTQLKKSRKWLSLMVSLKMTGQGGIKFTPPMWSHLYKVTTVGESNEKGAWSGFHIEVDEPVVDVNLYTAAKEFAVSIKAGLTKVSAPPMPEEEDLPTTDKPY